MHALRACAKTVGAQKGKGRKCSVYADAINLDTRAEVRREVARTQSFEGPTRGRLSGTLGTGANASQRHSVGRRTASQTGETHSEA